MKIMCRVILAVYLLLLTTTAQALSTYYVFNGHVTYSSCINVVTDELFSGSLLHEQSLFNPIFSTAKFDIIFQNGVTIQSNFLINDIVFNNDFLFGNLRGTGYSDFYYPDFSDISLASNNILIGLMDNSATFGYSSAIFASIDYIVDPPAPTQSPVPEPGTFTIMVFGFLMIGFARKWLKHAPRLC